jgi:hypothetical protein
MTLLTTIRRASDLIQSFEGPRRGLLPPLDKSLCWLCGYPFGHQDRSRRIEMAHIVSVEEAPGRENDSQNLIPLCRLGSVQSVTDYLDSVEPSELSFDWPSRLDVGCHDLYDEGLISRTEVRLARALQCGCLSTTRSARSAESLGQSLRREYGSTRGLPDSSREKWTAWTKAERSVRDLPEAELHKILTTACDSIKHERRRSLDQAAYNARRRSEHVLEAVQPWIEERSEVWPVYQRLLYEAALAFMAARVTPLSRELDVERAEQVEHLLNQSVTFAARAGKPREAWFSTAELFHARLLHLGRLGKGTVEECARDLESLLEGGSDSNDFDSLRWNMNFLLHRAKWHVLLCQPIEAANCIREARNRRDEGKGWTAMQRIHMNVIEGMALALQGEADQALPRLARAITSMAGGRAKRPEGIVDAMRCLADVLIKSKSALASSEWSSTLRSIASELDDGRSGTWTSRHSQIVVEA